MFVCHAHFETDTDRRVDGQFWITAAVYFYPFQIANTIHTNTFTDSINTVNTWKEALHHVQIHAKKPGTNSEVLDFIVDKFQRAQSSGY